MIRKFLIAFTLGFLLPALLIAQDGKVRGRVTDKESGEPLIGGSIFIEGTNLGASTDINGEYVILSVPPGTFTVKASYIGYAPYSISNIRVNSNITTTLDFQLSTTAVQLEAVEVVADRPLIQRNTTNTIRITTQEDVKNLPVRGLQNIVALNAGVVQQDGYLYVRGGRANEVAFYVEGTNVTNPFFSDTRTDRFFFSDARTENVTVVQEAIEEMQVQAGGYTAELGGANSGIVRTTMRTGGTSYKTTIDFQTDDFAKPGKEFLNTTAFGYRNAVVTVGGPLPFLSQGRIFLVAQHNYIRNRQQMLVEPFSFNFVSDIADPRGPGKPLPGPIEFKKNHLPNNYRLENSAQGTLLYDFNPIKLRFAGSYSAIKAPVGGNWPLALTRYFNQKRNPIDETNTAFANLRATHVLNPQTFYDVAVSYQSRSFKRVDPDFGDNWTQYTDSIANSQKGYTGFLRRYSGPLRYSVVNGFRMLHENAPNNSYTKNLQSSIGVSLDFTSQMNKQWEVKAGGRMDAWTVRLYTVSDITSSMEFLYGIRGDTPREFADANERRVLLAKQGVINHYGYDVDGNKVDEGLDGPKEPVFASAYIQNKLEYRDLVVNLGLRYEFMDSKSKEIDDVTNPPFDAKLDIIDESKLKTRDPFQLLLPRLSVSYPVTDKIVFYALYGKYAQMPALSQVYFGNTVVSRTVSPVTRGNAFLPPVGFFVKPERLTQYEIGLRQTLTDNLALTISGLYKDYRDQLAVRKILTAQGGPLYTAYTNEDFGTVKGLELTLELRRTNRLSSKLNYTLSDARGTGTDARSAFGALEMGAQGRYPSFISQLEFNQTHRGSLLLDYRFARGDGGPILEGLGLNLLITFNSGHNYTKIKEPADLGQANPWNVGIRPLIDPRSRNPVEPLNASSTPWMFNVDLNFSKVFFIGAYSLELYVNVLNLLNTQHVLNVYPSTGTAQDDGWLRSALATGITSENPDYAPFYTAINLNNRFAYMDATGNDLYGIPRQVRVGMKFEM